MIQVSENWRTAHPGGALGLLSMQIDRRQEDQAGLNQERLAIENHLREQYRDIPRTEIRQLPVMDAYTQYYKRFKKTYHVLLQLDSICNKNRSIPHSEPLVQAMFMAEMNSFILTAGHDLDLTRAPISLDSSQGDEIYQNLRGERVTCKAGDMLMSDNQSVICSIIYGQDRRTRITDNTQRVLYVMYVPAGIEAGIVENHILDIERNVGLVFPHSKATERQVIQADSTAAITL
jgi:DNA/RNA-binding domain of Phe-tRNA-synthetase-like protein